MFDASEGTLVPFLFVAVTVHVYSAPSDSPVTTTGETPAVAVPVSPPVFDAQVAVYPVIGLAPSSSGVEKATVAPPSAAAALTTDGAAGTVGGGLAGSDAKTSVPIARHDDEEWHDTAARSFDRPVFGLGTTLHAVPSHVSTSVSMPAGAVFELPTAMHDVSARHEMAFNEGWLPAVGLAPSVQVVPSHTSVTATPVRSVWSNSEPTATHDVTAVHDTACRNVSPARAGLSAIDHDVPFHNSTRSTQADDVLSKYSPTAVHDVEVTHETPSSALVPAPFGLGTSVHDVPFQDSVNVPSLSDPTAMHDVVVADDTERSVAELPGPLAVSTKLQLVPSHVSEKVVPAMSEPTATHDVVVAHDTEFRLATDVSTGALATVMLVPSQVPVTGETSDGSYPTAWHDVDVKQRTPSHWIEFGFGTIRQ